MGITSFTNKDTSAVSKLLRSYWKERKMNYSQEWTENYLREGHKIETTKELQFVAKHKDVLVGYISIIITVGGLAELRDFVIAHRYRGKGYGDEILRYAIQQCKHRGLRKVTALVFPATLDFYKKHGFFLEGYLKHHFKKDEHLLHVSIFLTKQLDKQVDLQKHLNTLTELQDVEKETSARLLRMKSGSFKK